MKAAEFLKLPAAKRRASAAIVFGPEEYLRSRVSDALVSEDEEVESFEGPTASPGGEAPFDVAGFFDALRTPSLFGDKRLIRVRRADKLVSDYGEALAKFLAAGEAVHRLLIEGEASLPKESGGRGKTKAAVLTRLIAAAESAGGVAVACDPPYDAPFGGRGPEWRSDLTQWLVDECAARGKAIRPETAYRLHRSAGTGLRELSGELDKLVAYVGPRKSIEDGDVERVVTAARASPIFDFADGFALADVKRALRASEELFERGVEDSGGRRTTDPAGVAMMVVATTTPRLRRLAAAVESVRSGASFDAAASEAGVAPFLRERFRAEVEAWRSLDVGAAVGAIARLEAALKSGGGPPRVLVDLAATEALGRGGAR